MSPHPERRKLALLALALFAIRCGGAPSPPTAPSATAPTAVTLSATGVVPGGATLMGLATPNGLATDAFFEWGPTASYGSTTPVQSVGSGSSAVSVVAALTGLSANTIYQYRLVARSSAGTSNGPNQTFTTPPLPSSGAMPSPATLSANGIGADHAKLNGSVTPNGLATEAFFEWGLTAGYGNVTSTQAIGSADTAQSVTETVTGLSPDTTYHYRLVARNSAGTTSGQDVTFRTGTNGAPPTVTTRAAFNITQTGATLDSQIRPNALDTQVFFEWGTTTSYGNTAPSQMVPSGNSSVSRQAAITGLASNTTYHFRVVGTSSGGTSHGADLTFATAFSGTPPSATTNAPSGVGSTGATLHGTTNPNGVATDAFFEWGTNSFANTTPAQPVSGTAPVNVSATLTGLSPATTYQYRFVAQFNSGRTTGATQTFTTDASGAAPFVTDNGETNVTANSVTLNGSVTPNGLATTAHYRWGETPSLGSVTPTQSMGSGSAPVSITANLTGLIPNMTYSYRLVAENSSGTTQTSNQQFTTAQGVGVPAVVDLGETNENSTNFTLNGRVSPNGLATEWYYEYGTTQSLGSTTAIQSIGSGMSYVTVSVQVTGLTPNTGYFYRLVARNSAGTKTSALQSAGTSK